MEFKYSKIRDFTPKPDMVVYKQAWALVTVYKKWKMNPNFET